MSSAGNILIVDDDPGTCQTIGDILEHRGYTVHTVTGGRQALATLAQRPVDAAILDIQLPDVPGLELMRTLKTSHPGLEVIVITGHASISNAIQALNDAAFAYLTKPFDVEHLMMVVDKALEKQRLERALRESEERYRLVTEHIQDAILLLDREGRVVFANRRGEELTGYTEAEYRNRPISSFLTPEGAAEAGARINAAKSGRDADPFFETELVRRDGSRIWVEAKVANVQMDGQLIGRLAVVRDISSRRRAEAALREQKQLEEQLRQAMKMEGIGRLAGGIAHDFNNLLTVIAGRIYLLLSQLPAGHAMREDLQLIEQTGERAAALTKQLLAFSRKQILAPIVLDLNDVVTSMKQLLERVLGEDIELIIDLDPSLGLVLADQGQLEQVVLNLAVNARDAMPNGGQLVLETSNVEVDDTFVRQHVDLPPGPYAALAVTDTGIGMNAETLARIFEPFFTTKEVGRGTGLGLATAYGIVKQSNGHIAVYSEPGHGTMAHAILQQQGYIVLEAAEAATAIRMADQYAGSIDLVVTDVVMPKMNGRILARAIQERRPDAKVLYMSGYPDDAIVRHGVLEPGTPFLQKPFTPGTLVRKIRQVLDQSR